MPDASIDARFRTARSVVSKAAQTALDLFRDRDRLAIEIKGVQDWVSNADKSVELQIRAVLGDTWPGDSIVGEEHDNITGGTGFTWVIDPIDGTTNFVNGTPGWCVVLACVEEDHTVCSVICDPVSNETYSALRGRGAWLNDKPLRVHPATDLAAGTLGVGHSTRVPARCTIDLLAALLAEQGMFRRGGSGALDLAYVAAGRLIGYVEPHMNAWDCLASLLLIEEAGGCVAPFDMQHMLMQGDQVVTACPGVFEQVRSLVQVSYNNTTREDDS